MDGNNEAVFLSGEKLFLFATGLGVFESPRLAQEAEGASDRLIKTSDLISDRPPRGGLSFSRTSFAREQDGAAFSHGKRLNKATTSTMAAIAIIPTIAQNNVSSSGTLISSQSPTTVMSTLLT